MPVVVVVGCLISSVVSVVSAVSDAAMAAASLSPSLPPLPAPCSAQVNGVTRVQNNTTYPFLLRFHLGKILLIVSP